MVIRHIKTLPTSIALSLLALSMSTQASSLKPQASSLKPQASSLKPQELSASSRWYTTGNIGIASVGSNTQQHFIVDEQVFTYQGQSKHQPSLLLGLQVGREFSLSNDSWQLQTGLQYLYNHHGQIGGNHTVGDTPYTLTSYSYRYQLNSQQLLSVVKLLSNHWGKSHPYLSGGLGASFNHSQAFSTQTTNPGSINLTPNFSGSSTTQFSYALGLGLEQDFNPHLRVGLGYQFADLGSSRLNPGAIHINQTTLPVPFGLEQSHHYLNSIALQLTYLA